ncbi:MAG: DNA translocase FtsK 4TM domain-containing protein, partial [Burkholderiaceae bacterium]|nr:DNA translocase FtsK 4TM domain-containing protein [Burkholderiaceae bacterium]
MTFPLGSLRTSAADSSPGAGLAAGESRARDDARGTPRSFAHGADWRRQARVLIGGVSWLLVLIAMLTHHPLDAAFSTSGSGEVVRNSVGTLGAWASDLMLFLFGFSAWWLIGLGLHRWLAALADLLRRGSADTPIATPVRTGWPSWVSWLGLALLLSASTSLEWTRMYHAEAQLPGGHAGGVLGYLLGPLSMKGLGFAGSGVLWIAALVAGLSLAFRFSWLQLADAIGERLDAWRDRRVERIERAEDMRLGEQALREREDIAEVEHELSEDHAPIVIAAPVVEVPKSDRVVKERQKPLFVELADTRLPQVDLLDAAPSRTETVSLETLEMTSRLIEKKLKDFGVEVRVVAASPGPVITRYEIEPATGVKGAQVLGLAKDLARSLSLVSIRVVETIPGKTTMALELPNARRQTIHLSEILGSQAYNGASSMLTMGLGKDIVGAPVVADLAKMPHCLVAGTTGSGKSVGINAMILSLLYKAD